MRTLIYEMRAELDKVFCSHVIDKFENDSERYQGFVGPERKVNLDIKQSIDLKITDNKNWEEENKIFYQSFRKSLECYAGHIRDLAGDTKLLPSNFYDTGYQIQKTSPGGFYTWHHDYFLTPKSWRVITVIWYLNDVIEDGYTEFIDGTKIQPEVGKVILFPATWSYIHRGYPPKSENKYICTGWLHCQI